MGWGNAAEEVAGMLPAGSHTVSYDDVGHFVHIEQPHRVAALALDFLADHAVEARP
jgi:pimeloyl-ACP methyl ester carboxylesterase